MRSLASALFPLSVKRCFHRPCDGPPGTFPFLFRHGQQATSMIFLLCSLPPGELEREDCRLGSFFCQFPLH
jgi:hypothetical protein